MRIRNNFVVTNDGECLIAPVLRQIIVERIHPDARIPTYVSEGDSGFDVYAPEDVVIQPGQVKLIKLGIKLQIPKHPLHDFGYRWECQIRPRSGISSRILMAIMLGTIDNPYRGEIGVSIHNNNAMPDTPPIFMPYSLKGERIVCDEADSTLRAYCGAYLIRKGERFAQIVFNEVVRPLEIVEGKVSDDTDRGNRGFGSSGV